RLPAAVPLDISVHPRIPVRYIRRSRAMAPGVHRREVDTWPAFAPKESLSVQIVADVPPAVPPDGVILYSENVFLRILLKRSGPGLVHDKGALCINEPVCIIAGNFPEALPELLCQTLVAVPPSKTLG